MQVMELANGRASLHEAFKHLLVGGNALLYVSEEGIRVIHLDRYVLVRDPMGHVTEIVVEEEVYPEALPTGFIDSEEDYEDDEYDEDEPAQRTLKIYTCVKFYDGQCHWYQECKGREIPGTHGMSSEENSPWIPLRFDRTDTEEYGRSYVEQYYGDLLALESLYQAVLEGSAAAAKVLFLVNPNGTTRPRTWLAQLTAPSSRATRQMSLSSSRKRAKTCRLLAPLLIASSRACSLRSCSTLQFSAQANASQRKKSAT